MQKQYWIDCISEAVESCGAVLTKEQIASITEDVRISHENYGMAFYTPDSAPANQEVERLKRELGREKSKVSCPICGGRGSITKHGPYHSSTSQCWKCHGEGKVLP